MYLKPYQTTLYTNTFNKQNPNIILIYIQTRDLKFASGDYISSVSQQKAT